ncbi:MAG: hypothetical protein QG599_1335 [Pseudomonadota bacterium]|nr:hypothetical protein [Pseudomonadota bacterium]
MSLPLGNPDTTFDSFWQELPANYHELALEFKAFTRSRKIKVAASVVRPGRNCSGSVNAHFRSCQRAGVLVRHLAMNDATASVDILPALKGEDS